MGLIAPRLAALTFYITISKAFGRLLLIVKPADAVGKVLLALEFGLEVFLFVIS